VLARGGGSLEDLWAFNSEALAYEIYACDIPIISAVGHEIDYSISDFVADLRAETPSAAAELITEEQTKIKERLLKSKKSLTMNFEMRIVRIKNKLKELDPKSLMSEYQNYFLGLNKRLERNNLIHRLNELTHINDYYMNLDFAISKMEKGMKRVIENENSKIEKYNSILTVTDPKNVLLRGYTYIEKDSKSYVLSAMSFDTLSENTKLNIHFKDGIRTVVAHEDKKK
jgi:exodeoxyribonuclease VII large subunit